VSPSRLPSPSTTSIPSTRSTYAWSGNGGQVTGKETTGTDRYCKRSPGSYAVSVHVTDPKAKTANEASCTANYTIQAAASEKPTDYLYFCQSDDRAGRGTIGLSASCSSPDGVPVTVATWTSSGGTVLRLWHFGHVKHNGRLTGFNHRRRDLHRHARPRWPGVDASDGGKIRHHRRRIPEIVQLEARLALHSITSNGNAADRESQRWPDREPAENSELVCRRLRIS